MLLYIMILIFELSGLIRAIPNIHNLTNKIKLTPTCRSLVIFKLKNIFFNINFCSTAYVFCGHRQCDLLAANTHEIHLSNKEKNNF